jgi:tetratricopeptide (TPR) repeat protein
MVEQHNQHIDKLVELTHKAYKSQSSQFVLVHYDRKEDSEQFIDKLSNLVKVNIYHPQHQPDNSKLYAAFKDDEQQQTLSLICDQPNGQPSVSNNPSFISYLNFNADRLIQDSLHLVLFIPTDELSSFVGVATDLAKMRQQTFYLQHKTAIYQFNWLHNDDIRQSISEKSSQNSEETDNNLKQQRDHIATIVNPIEHTQASIELAQWLTSNDRLEAAHTLISEAINNKESDSVLCSARLHSAQADINNRLNDNKTAMTYYRYSLSEYHQLKDRDQELIVHRNIAKIYHKSGDSQSALRHLKLALMISLELEDLVSQSKINQQMAHIYHAKKEINKALFYLKQSLVLSQQLNDKITQAATLNDIAKVYYFKSAQEAALNFLDQSLLVLAELEDRAGECAVLYNIAAINRGKKDIEATLSYLKLAQVKAQEVGAEDFAHSLSANIAQLYQSEGIEMTPGEDATTARFGVSPQDFNLG